MARASKDFKLIDVIPAGDTVGEGVLWDWRKQALWWTDIQRSRLYRYDWSTRERALLPAPERIGSFGLVAVFRGADHGLRKRHCDVRTYCDARDVAGTARSR
jgi:sugar lactone lactonase YvrE